jgi:DNA-binding XRE family transcriptional regulator
VRRGSLVDRAGRCGWCCNCCSIGGIHLFALLVAIETGPQYREANNRDHQIAFAAKITQRQSEHNNVQLDRVQTHYVWTNLHTIGCTGCFPEAGAAVESIAIRFGTVLRRRREAARVSQESLAAKAELHRNYVGLLERGKQIPTILVVEKLATTLGTTMSSLMREVEKARSDEK